MQLTITLNHGPLDVEFNGDDREELQEELLGFSQFIEENSGIFDGVEFSNGKSTDEEEPGIDSDYWEEKAENGGSSEGDSKTNGRDHPLASLARQTGSSVDRLDEIIYVDPEGEEPPQLLIDKSRLGSKKAERQRHAAYLLLLVWENCYEEERMKNSDLKRTLSIANISDNNLYNAWAGAGKGNFDPSGRGASATLGLTGPGEREALKLMKKLAEEDDE